MEAGDQRADIHVLIIGAGIQAVLMERKGISGLLLAQGLKKHEIPFSIFESEDSAKFHRAREWGMSIQWALPMLADLLPNHLLERLQSDASVDPHYVFPETGNTMPIYNAETGELMKSIPLVKMLRVSRRRLRRLCAEGIEVQYGKRFRSMTTSEDDGKITVHFSDDSQTSGTLVVGADGANSAVRNAAFFDTDKGKAVTAGYAGANMHVCYGDASIARLLREHLSPILGIAMHPRGHWLWFSIQDVPDPEKPEGWVFQLQWTFKLGPETAGLSELNLENLKADASKYFAEPWRSAWEKIPPGTRVPNNRLSIWQPAPIPSEAWGGRVALVGDAAHAMSFHRGQGMNHGIADAVELTKILSAGGRGKEAVLQHEAEMIKRAGEEVAISKSNTEMVHDWDRLMQSPLMQRGGDKNR
ncbi:uncharacterized protein LTR77_001747 [Saxophila tyrrhenica]|uniref:FAD-binding domain-containing protein n=1 Tax=Saxophila tyrrhenica TaxID=1690608 RepID=A0AAV9PLY1_9PEZI|nr:hypothetical protein LTR77_001747 [Saxophila tyrrhenica]